MWRSRGAALGVVAALALSGCGGAEPGVTLPAGGCRALDVVVTTSILGDVVANVVGSGGRVTVLMPPGADPHSFQASASQAGALRQADLVVVNGLGLEEGMAGVVEAARADGVRVVEAASFVDPLPLSESGAGEPSLDPHIWTDPVRMADVVAGLGEALAGIDPVCAEGWRAAAAGYVKNLMDLDAEIRSVLSVVPAERRRLVTNHDTLGYLADRYGFEVVGVIIPGGSTLAEPSPADLAVLVGALRSAGVPVVFAENTRPAALAETLAAELGEGVAVVDLYTDALGEPGSGADTYLGMLRLDAGRIAAALGGP